MNFSELAAAAEAAGCSVLGSRSQAEFLMTLGAGQLVESARSDIQEYFERRRAFQQLTDPAGLGRVRVMAALKHLETLPPGFEEAE